MITDENINGETLILFERLLTYFLHYYTTALQYGNTVHSFIDNLSYQWERAIYGSLLTKID
jgi:hypothetical protein